MLFLTEEGGTTMEHMDLGALIVAGICGIGLIQLIMWIVVIFRHPGFGDLRLDLVKTTCPQSSVTEASSNSRDKLHKGLL
jgi:hypothetical protein